MQERAVTQLYKEERVVYMSEKKREQENQNMKRVERVEKEINFTNYAQLDKAYTKQELAEIYKKIIQDIDEGKYD